MSKKDEVAKSNYYRRCHVCDSVISSDEPIHECKSCGKVLAPFFYFDVRKSRVYADNQSTEMDKSEKYRPIDGLTAFW